MRFNARDCAPREYATARTQADSDQITAAGIAPLPNQAEGKMARKDEPRLKKQPESADASRPLAFVLPPDLFRRQALRFDALARD
jgi:hypothetical protein